MTPRTLDWQMLQAKLRLMRRRLDTLASLGPVDASMWDRREVESLAVERVLILVVDLAVDINNHVASVELKEVSADYTASFALAAQAGLIDEELAGALAPSAGARNVLVHDYLDVDHRKVATAATLAVTQYGEYVRQVAQWVQKRSAGT